MKPLVRLAGASFIGALALSAAWGWYVMHPSLWPEYRQATALIDAVEQFRSAHGRLPISASELRPQSESIEGMVFYQVTSSQSYEVWFGRALGESYTDDSSSRSWR